MDYDFNQNSPASQPEIDYLPPLDKIYKEADFYINNIKIITYNNKEYDISLLRTELSIYEDLFSPVLSGYISFEDSNDLPQLLPIIGQEKLFVSFTRPKESGEGLLDEVWEQTFRIYKMSNQKMSSQRENSITYVLYFTKEEHIKNLSTRVSKSYLKMPISDIVEKIYNSYLVVDKPIEIESTLFDRNIVIPNYHPIESITMLANEAISAHDNLPGYMFWEDLDKFNFKSFGHLLDQRVKEKFKSQIGNILDNAGNISHRDRTIEDDIFRVEFYEHKGNFDLLKGLKNGLYGSKLLTIDPLRQIYKEYETNYSKEWDRSKKLGKHKKHTDDYPLITQSSAHYCLSWTDMDHDKVEWIKDKDPDIKPINVEQFILQRKFQIDVINKTKIQLEISGDPRRRVGDIIEFHMPNRYGAVDENHPPDPPENRYLSGKYLITALKHRLQKSKYYNDIEIVKDSFVEKIEHVDLVEFLDWSF